MPNRRVWRASATAPAAVEPTSGVLLPAFTQANMIVLPRDWAFDFLLYAQRNPKACPVLDVSDPGSHATSARPRR
jgi:uncharacterized protein YcsI (UPF0317 family)